MSICRKYVPSAGSGTMQQSGGYPGRGSTHGLQSSGIFSLIVRLHVWAQVLEASESAASAVEEKSAARRQAYREQETENEREFERGEIPCYDCYHLLSLV